ncbi:conjugal transfer protein TrbH [Rhizobium calliandrae]|uniref:Conjugal transfer protein TrbH n=1 Tax=Rhizobium calliandrae TaxID=1312182 RepID=A0ABT7KGF1_9HYPH|nr:conjugal transfer protein TrbH [Rhizobium calliandrae]MDL2407632.1 conjugal transfer protein TrbH [Rhizobium calliandrae]
MWKRLVVFIAAAFLTGCQTVEDRLAPNSNAASVSGPAASAIASDMASRLAEQIGPAKSTTIKMEKDTSNFATSLQAALKDVGYTVLTDGKVGKDANPVELAYSIDGVGGQVLARLSTPFIALGRAYTATAAGVTPASPLSIMQRN